MLVNYPKSVTACYAEQPDPSIALQPVGFGTSGYRSFAFERSFNQDHGSDALFQARQLRGAGSRYTNCGDEPLSVYAPPSAFSFGRHRNSRLSAFEHIGL